MDAGADGLAIQMPRTSYFGPHAVGGNRTRPVDPFRHRFIPKILLKASVETWLARNVQLRGCHPRCRYTG